MTASRSMITGPFVVSATTCGSMRAGARVVPLRAWAVGRQPAAVDQHDRALAQPVAVVDRPIGPMLALKLGEERPHQLADGAGGEMAGELGRERGKPAEEIESRAG